MAITLEQYQTKRTNITISIQNDYEMLETWQDKEFVPMNKLDYGERLIVVLCGFCSVHDMLEDTRKVIERKKKSLQRLENKIAKIKEQ